MSSRRLRAGESLPPPGYRTIQEVRSEPIPTPAAAADADEDPQTPDECDGLPWNLYRVGAGGQRSLLRTLPARPWESDAAPYGAGLYSAMPLHPRTRRPYEHLEQILSIDDAAQAPPVVAPSTLPQPQNDLAAMFTLMLQQQAQQQQIEAARRERERIEQQERDEREQRRRDEAEARRRTEFREMAALAIPVVQTVLARPETAQTQALLEQLRAENQRLTRKLEAERAPSAMDKYMEFAVQRKMMKAIADDEKDDDDDDDEPGVLGALGTVAKAALPMIAARVPQLAAPPADAAPQVAQPAPIAALAAPLRDPATLQQVILHDPDGVLGSLVELARQNPELGKSIASQVRKAANGASTP